YISFAEAPKFYRISLSEHLSGEKFNRLLIYNDETTIANFIENLARRTNTNLRYDYAYIVSGINQLLPAMTTGTRAKCCADFMSEYDNEIKSEPYPEFILDFDGNKVNANQQIFLSPETADNHFPQPPKYAQLVYLHKELSNALRKTFGISTLRDLSAKLNKLNVHEYNLTEIIKSVISKFKNSEHQESNNIKECCADMIVWLWKLSETYVLANINLELRIPIIARDGKIRNADMLYLGMEYGNDITENLFPNRNDWFVAAIDTFNISVDNTGSFVNFLYKLGVARFPRITDHAEIYITLEYKERLISDIVYPLKVENNYYQNADELNDRAFINNIAHVPVIEKYEEILKTDTQHIINWLMSDDSAKRLVSSKYEYPQSKVYLTEGYQRNGRLIPHNQVSCFMRFVFATRQWIEIDGEKYSPFQCLFYSKIGKKLLPHAIMLDLDKYVTKQNKRNHEINAIKEILVKIGASEDFSDLLITTLYGILLKLPDVDETGEISKALYQSILGDHGNLNMHKEKEEVREFFRIGKVFCKSNKTFVPLKNVYYLTEKTVSNEILKSFNLIAIPSRQNQKKIKEYFGVEPLKLKGSIVGQPVFHDSDGDFALDFTGFKLYAFCYRVSKAKQVEISAVKSLKVRLCNKIKADYGNGVVELDNYAFIRNDKEVYLKASSGKNMTQLKTDLGFCAAVAEIFTSTVDIQESELFICLRSLCGQHDSQRQKQILQDFDDLNVLTNAKEKLELTQTQHEMFLRACEEIGGTDKQDELREIIDTLKFDDINCVANGEKLLRILRTLNVDVQGFNDRSEFEIDMRKYYVSEMLRLSKDNETCYKNSLFASFKSKSLEEQEGFEEAYDAYRSSEYLADNTVHFDVQQHFFEKWEVLKTNEDANESWKKNRDIFIADKSAEIFDDLLSHPRNNSLLYFGAFEELNRRYDRQVEKAKNRKQGEQSNKAPVPTPNVPIQTVEVKVPTSAKTSTSTAPQRSHGNMSKTVRQASERDKSLQGSAAEKLVFESLRKDEKYQNVKWVSENAKKDGINPDGIDGLGYDLMYTDKSGMMVFVEVKSTVGNALSFMITENELSFAEDHHSQYEIWLVTNVEDNDNCKINRIPNLFSYQEGETRSGNGKFHLTADNYTICCEEQNTCPINQ
ncbi:hypothetical protein EZS27_025343, partial [termite gut metagenome]